MLSEVPSLKNQLKKCVRCGQCRSVCPIFDEMKTETYAPRGRVFLSEMLQRGEITPSDEVAKKLSICLLCESCSSQCPSGIEVHKFVTHARSFVAQNYQNPVKRLVFKHIWANQGLLKAVFGAMRGYEGSGLRSALTKTGALNLLPGNLPKIEKILGKVPSKRARKFLPKVVPAKGKKNMQVAYFLGCGTDHLYPHIAQATVDVLTRNGCEVLIPDIECCGLPQMGNGELTTAQSLMAKNLEIFSQVKADLIITDCGSCTATLAHYGDIFENTPLVDKAREFSKKICDISVFLTDKIDLNQELGKLPSQVVTYHDSCHLSKSAGITAQPRKLLMNIPGLEYREMKEADRCCGGAGTFSLFNYDLSMKILDKKTEAIRNTDASIVTTACPTCSMQLTHGINNHNISARVLHPLELLRDAYVAAEK